MRVLFDALGAPTTSGGMRQYAELLITAWVDANPEDDVVVIGDAWVSETIPRVRHVRWGSDRFLTRSFGQLLVTGLLHHLTRRDVTISVSTVVSGLAPRSRRICVVHDWRHVRRPEEFGRLQRAYRRLWVRSARTASAVVSISEKTLDESRRYVPSGRHVLVVSGHDHASRWNITRPSDRPVGPIVTFGHHPNKRPDLVMRAFARSRIARDRELVVLGASGQAAEALRAEAVRLGVGESVHLPGFVDETTYRSLIASSAAVVLASSDEGFGLPGAEASYFGIPFIVTTDGGLDRIHTGAIVADAEERSLAEAIDRSAQLGNAGLGRRLRTWHEAADELRAIATATARSGGTGDR